MDDVDMKTKQARELWQRARLEGHGAPAADGIDPLELAAYLDARLDDQATERLDLKQFVSALDELQQIWRATDLGRVKSVATIPSISTHQQQGEEGRKLAHIPGNLIRLCVGGEHPDDVIADLDQALHKMRARVTLSVAEEISGPPRAEPEAPSPVGS